MTSSIVVSSCIKDCRQRDFHWLQRPKCSFILFEMILVMEIMYNAVKRLRDGLASRPLSALSAIHVYSSNVMNWVEVRLLPSIPCLFSSNISNTAPPASDSVKYYYFPSPPPPTPPSRFVVILCCVLFLSILVFLLAGFNLFVLLPIYAFARCCDKRISSSNNNQIKK